MLTLMLCVVDWMKLQETKLPMSGPPLESGKSTEVEEKETTETLSLSGVLV